MRYLEVGIRCQRGAAPAVEHLVSDLTGGGFAVDDPLDVIQNLERGTWEITDLVPGNPEWVTVKGWLAEANDLDEARLRLEEGLIAIRSLNLGATEPPHYTWVQEEDWANAWRAYFKPFRVGERLMVIPSWESYALQPGDLPLYLDPGMAFGTGTHTTTALCLRWLEKLVTPGMRVVDVGTGSGILAIAAARLGANRVTALDLDPVAVKIARENAMRNEVTIDVHGSPLGQVDEATGDLIVANIIAAVIIEILPDIVARLQSGGLFLASGIIAEKKQTVLDAMTATWLLPVESREEGGWVAILAMKP